MLLANLLHPSDVVDLLQQELEALDDWRSTPDPALPDPGTR